TKTEPVRPNLLGAPARHCLRLLPRFTSRTPSGVPSDPSDLPTSASAPPVKGLLRLPNKTRKQFFEVPSSFFQERPKTTQNQDVEVSKISSSRR
ncbi:hypothetical protein, partial [uncultured Mameliella sp.]|uniref:hypothetical protein n=1 Tax=uncultured Mameliella sp. TaxID=1447087 RepID=UPI00260CCEAD